MATQNTYDYFGYDLYFDSDELDLFSSIGRDFKIVSGKGNLAQALKSRLETLRGELGLHPTYGSDLYTLIGQPNDDSTRNTAVTLLTEALQDESRISSITAITVSTDAKIRNVIRLTATVVLEEIDEEVDLYYNFFL